MIRSSVVVELVAPPGILRVGRHCRSVVDSEIGLMKELTIVSDCGIGFTSELTRLFLKSLKLTINLVRLSGITQINEQNLLAMLSINHFVFSAKIIMNGTNVFQPSF